MDDAPRTAPSATCLDCGQPATGAFCSHCGQRTDTGQLRLGRILREALASCLNTDGRLPRTLIGLATNPGRVATEYTQGKRTRYMSPIKLAVLASTVWFFALSFFAVDTPSERLLAAYGQIGNLALMPGFALCFQLTFAWTRARYVEHLVLALYVFGLAASWRAVLVLVGNGLELDAAIANHLDGLAFLFYLAYALWTFHAGRNRVGRVLAIVGSIVLTVVLSIAVVSAFLAVAGVADAEQPAAGPDGAEQVVEPGE